MTRTSATSSSSQQRASLEFIALGVVVALVALGFVRWSGVSAALDSRLSELFYQVRGERSSDKSVILVEIDDSSIERWGPLPWEPERYVQLVQRIRSGKPRAIAFLEPSALIWKPGAERPIHGLEEVSLPPIHPIRADEPLFRGTGRTISTVPLRTPIGNPTIFARLLHDLGYATQDHELPVNFLGPGAEVPLLSAAGVEQGNLSARTFANRVILIGRAHTETVQSVPTPVGAMTLSQVYAHALLAYEDHAIWWRPDPIFLWVFLAAYAIIIMGAMYRRTMRTMSLMAVVFAFAPVLVSYVGFATGTVLFSVADPMSVTLAAFTVAVLVTESEARFRLARLARDVAQHKRLSTSSGDQFWKDIIQVGRAHTSAHSSMIAEIVPSTSLISIHAIDGVSAEDIAETNRDVGKDPFRNPWQNRRSEKIDNFMVEALELQTLLVPLVVDSKTIGFWILNFRIKDVPTAKAEQTIVRYASLIAHGLAERHAQLTTRPRRGQSKTTSRDSLASTLDSVDTDMQNVLLQYRFMGDLFAHMPVGIAVASLWLDIQSVNVEMEKLLAEANIGINEIRDFAVLIAKLARMEPEVVRRQLSHVAESKAPITIAVPDSEYSLTLAWLYVADGEGGAPLGRFVLTTNHGQVAPSGVSGGTSNFDVNTVLMQALSILRADTSLPERQIRIELEHPLPRAAGNVDNALMAVIAMLRDTFQHGNPNMPCMLSVENGEDGDQIIITVSDATYSIPEDVVQGMLRQSSESEDTESSLAAVSNRLEETKTGHLEVESLYGSGIMFRLQLSSER